MILLHSHSPWPGWHRALMLLGLVGVLSHADADPLADLARPHEGRSMRATSTMRVGEVRRGGGERRRNPQAERK